MSVPDPAVTDWVPIYAGSPAFTYLGDYVPATAYKDGDIVMYNGTPWLAVKNTNTPPDPFPLEGGGGADLTYEGDHVPATEYKDGEIVVKNGIAYLCVGGPTTVAPDPTSWGTATLVKPAYGTTLPVSPVDGQEAILVDSVSNPTFQWRFRYNASATGPYKWEFIGGNSLHVFVGGTVLSMGSANTWTNIGSGAITIPRTGIYEATCELSVQCHTFSAAADLRTRFSGSVTGVWNHRLAGVFIALYHGWRHSLSEMLTDMELGETLTSQVTVSQAMTINCYDIMQRLTPVRVA